MAKFGKPAYGPSAHGMTNSNHGAPAPKPPKAASSNPRMKQAPKAFKPGMKGMGKGC